MTVIVGNGHAGQELSADSWESDIQDTPSRIILQTTGAYKEKTGGMKGGKQKKNWGYWWGKVCTGEEL